MHYPETMITTLHTGVKLHALFLQMQGWPNDWFANSKWDLLTWSITPISISVHEGTILMARSSFSSSPFSEVGFHSTSAASPVSLNFHVIAVDPDPMPSTLLYDSGKKAIFFLRPRCRQCTSHLHTRIIGSWPVIIFCQEIARSSPWSPVRAACVITRDASNRVSTSVTGFNDAGTWQKNSQSKSC